LWACFWHWERWRRNRLHHPIPVAVISPFGGSLPIGSGAVILITLGVGYAAKKAYQAREKIID